MNDSHYPASPDHLDPALEASCEALVALQLMRTLGGDQIQGAEGQMSRAIKSLRLAIAELRMARIQRASALAHGFVADLAPSADASEI